MLGITRTTKLRTLEGLEALAVTRSLEIYEDPVLESLAPLESLETDAVAD